MGANALDDNGKAIESWNFLGKRTYIYANDLIIQGNQYAFFPNNQLLNGNWLWWLSPFVSLFNFIQLMLLSMFDKQNSHFQQRHRLDNVRYVNAFTS